MTMSEQFRIGLTRDFLDESDNLSFPDIGLGLLDAEPRVSWEFLPERVRELPPEYAARYDAIVALGVKVTAASLAGEDRRLALVSRFGVGYDMIDVPACTRAGVLLTITPDGVRRPVAQAVLTFILSLAGKLLIKDRITRAGRWRGAAEHMGMGVTGRTLGLIGVGNIGRDVVKLVAPFEMRVLAHDPYARQEDLAPLGVTLVDLDTLLAESDFVSVNCPLNDETRHLVGARALGLMKPSAYLINTARGPIVDEAALYTVLAERRIAGAGLDVFEEEPTPSDNPLFGLDNVILTPHALCWTDECFRGNGEGACTAALDVARGAIPKHVVNRDVLTNPWLRDRLRQFASRKLPHPRKETPPTGD
jgi:D-3-phosphoglycerate dehydrogenase